MCGTGRVLQRAPRCCAAHACLGARARAPAALRSTLHAPAPSATADNLSKPYLEANKLEVKGAAAGGPTFTAEAVLGALPKKTRECGG